MIINQELKALIPPLAPDEYAQLEANILKDGCRDPLVLWGDTLVDGHNRYEICTANNIEYKTVNHSFESLNEVKEWMITNQFGRRNLNNFVRAELALKLKPVLAEKAKSNQSLSGGDKVSDKALLENSPKAVTAPIDTRLEIAKAAQVSDNTIARVEKILSTATPEVITAVRSGELSVNQAYQQIKNTEKNHVSDNEPSSELTQDYEAGIPASKYPKNGVFENNHPQVIEDTNEDINPTVATKNHVHVSANSGENEWYTPSEFIEAARRVMGGIELDPASSEIANKTVNAGEIFTKDDSGLEKDWYGNVWLNPPYAQPLMSQFADKVVNSIESFNSCIVLVNNATETKWFQHMARNATAICFPASRIKFIDPSGNPSGAPLQGQSFLYFGQSVDKFVKEFSEFGFVVVHHAGI